MPIQTVGFNRVGPEKMTFAWLEKNGHGRIGRGEIDAMKMLTPAVAPGVMLTYLLPPPNPINALARRVPDPITNNYHYKLA